MEENNTKKVEINELDKANFVDMYETLSNTSFNEKITVYFNDYGLNSFKYGVDENKIDEAYKKALDFFKITEDEFNNLPSDFGTKSLFLEHYYYNQILKSGDVVLYDTGERYKVLIEDEKGLIKGVNLAYADVNNEKYQYNTIHPNRSMVILEQSDDVENKRVNQEYRDQYLIKDEIKFSDDISRSADYEKQIQRMAMDITEIKQNYNYDNLYEEDAKFIDLSEKFKQLNKEYKEFNKSLFSKIKELDEIIIDNVKELVTKENNFIAVFDKETGNYIQGEIENKEIEPIDEQKVITDLKPDNEITLDKVLDELMSRTDIKTLTLDINIDGKSERFVTNNDEPDKSISNAVDKIRETAKNFKNIVIVYSKEELEFMQKEYRERNGLGDPEEKSDKANEKSYSEVKAEFAEKINNNENLSKGYIRISDDDFAKLGDILDKNEIPHVSSKSDYKDGINITVPVDKMDQLKEILISNDIKCMQIVYGNIDWKKIKDSRPNTFHGVTKAEFEKFQKVNNAQYKYIAFENDKGFSLYTEKDCDIKIKVKVQAKKEKSQNEDSKDKNASKKTVAKVKKEVSNVKKEESYKLAKDEFSKKIENDMNIEKGYIRISDDDFAKLGNILDKNEIPHVSSKSDYKDGINITVPVDKVDQLKEILIFNDVKCLQIVHGNIDLQGIINREHNVCVDVTKEELSKFQELNKDKFGYAAFENGDGKTYSVYTMKNCNIPINSSHLVRMIESQDKTTLDETPKENIDNKKTLNQVKKSVDDSKKEKISKDSEKTNHIEKSNNNKER